VLNLGNDTTVVALSYTLEAYPGFADYLWNDGDTNSTKTIDASGLYWLDIIDNNGCPASDTIDIWFKIRDIQTLAILNPLSSCDRTGTEHVSIEIENNGTDTVFIADNILLSYKLDEFTRVNETIHINNFLPGQTYMHPFAGTVDLTGFGTYNIDVTATTPGDLRTANDTLYAFVYTRANPVVNFGIEDYQPIKATQYILDAGSGADYVYFWQDGSTNQTYTATSIGEYSVIVTDASTGCFGGDTVQLYLDILDYTATAIGISASTCAGIYEDVPVTLLNNGNLPRGSANLTLKYMSENSLLFTEIYNSTTNWPAAGTRSYLTQNTINLNTTGSKQLKVIVLSTGDLRPENDTLKKTINVIPNPVVNFGGDVLYKPLPYILNAGSGQASYLWSDGSTNSTLTVTEDGVYSVTVTGTNGCVTTRNVGINVGLFVSDLAAKEMKVTIYPVPATDFVTIEAEFEHPGEFILEIIDAQDRIIDIREITDQSYKENLYIGNYSPGIYFIRIRNNEMYHVSRMIIQ
jgi:hypothetical protein